ncbi:MAG: TonB-dependent receptor plug domain-containing protein, partial [Bacteroidales bacterium]|nr:TonB-dependent receptor plug domain-containing protein [Bacteroidales bacterium]
MRMKRYYTIIILALASAFGATAQEAGGEDMLKDTLHAANIISDKNTFDNSTQTGLMRIDGSKFRTGYAVFNSPDVIKTLQMLPGVASGTELLSGFYVRGGTGSDNLFLLDGVPLYQVSHLGGLFSSFNADIVGSTDFYKSGFPARYGGRLSSVVDVTTAPGDMYEYHGSFSIGLIDGRIQYEGPIVKGKTSFNMSLRRSWLDLVSTPALAIVNRKLKKEDNQTINAGFNFNDFNAGITHKFSEDNILRVNFYRGRDRLNTRITDIENPYNPDTDSWDLDYEDISIIGGNMHWGNTLVSGVWKKNFSDRLSGQTSAWYS